MLNAFIRLLGKDWVQTDEALLAALNQATFLTTNCSIALIQPKNTAELSDCVRLANKYGVALYPISGGKNWGNGSCVPTSHNAILVDLHRLNRIVDFSEELAYVTVQAGVTQIQLFEFLKSRQSKLMPCLTGSSREASVVANVLERGDGFGIYGDRARYVCDLEVVLPNGDLFQTGYGRFQNASCAPLNAAGLGPSLDGLFLQSNLGIVTQMTLWLEAKPLFHSKIFFHFDSTGCIETIIKHTRELQLKKISPYVTWWNDVKIRARTQRSDLQYPSWMGSVTLFAYSEEQAAAQIQLTQNTLSGFCDTHCQHIKHSEHYDYENTPMLRSDGGLIWGMILLPYAGNHIVKALQTTENIFKQYGFEANLTLISTDSRSIRLLFAIVYDRVKPGNDTSAQNCHDAILNALMKQGHYPYRLGLQSMWAMGKNDVLKCIKKQLDPNDILAPGRYSPT